MDTWWTPVGCIAAVCPARRRPRLPCPIGVDCAATDDGLGGARTTRTHQANKGGGMFRSIVVGTDGSSRSRQAVAVAAGLARTHNATLHLVHAFRPVLQL